MVGRSTTGSISLGVAFVAGRNLVPRPATGMIALVTAGEGAMWRTLASGPGECERGMVGDEAVSPEFADRKAQLRASRQAARRELPQTQRAARGRPRSEAVLPYPPTQMAGTVAAYVSVGSEPSTRALIFTLWKRG